MDKNNLIGFILIALVLIGFSWYTRPSAEEQRAAFVQDSIAQVARMNAEKQRQAVIAAGTGSMAGIEASPPRRQRRNGRPKVTPPPFSILP